MPAERRKQRRFSVQVDAYCNGAARAGVGRLSNLSAGGCRITSSVPLGIGETAVFTLYFGKKSLAVSGRVVAVTGRTVSVRFENMTLSVQNQLDEFLASLSDRPLASRATH
ncbi:MAG TPA: PilZ domain-containing protein [Vicinamibacterales bacterium]